MVSIAALARFEMERLLDHPRTVLALGAFLVLHATGWAFSLDSDRFFGYAYLTALAVGLPGALHSDRSDGFLEFLRSNLAGPTAMATARLVALSGWVLALGLWTSFVGLALSRGDPAFAVWYPGLFTLVGILLLPGVITLDLATGSRFPVPVLYILFVAAAVAFSATGRNPDSIREIFALPPSPASPGDLLPVAVRTLPALFTGWLLLLGGMSPGIRAPHALPSKEGSLS